MKKKYIVIISIILVITGTLLWARFISTSGLEIHEIKIENSQIPESFNGLKIVHFTDLHYGMTVDKKRLDSIVDTINSLTPDIVIFTGDLMEEGISFSNQDIEDITNAFSNIKTKLGKYSVVGNHDFNNTFYKKIMEDSEFMILNNSYDLVYNEGYEPIFLGGLGTYLYGDANVNELLSYSEQLPEYRILLIHEGDVINEVKDKEFDLILGGHSHNGQVRLPFIGSVYQTEGAKEYHLPHYTIDNTEIYISNGIGCSKISFRFFNKPSINFYRLTK